MAKADGKGKSLTLAPRYYRLAQFEPQIDLGGKPSIVGDTYAQLLRMNDPEQNVVVGSLREPLANS